jgi:sulfite reductase (NADPH) flavoprotein alpha-component
MFILTATYGDGAAPASANRFLERLSKLDAPAVPRFAVLGFGDRSFSHYCQFAEDIETALLARGWTSLLPLSTIDRQSSQSFSQWGVRIGRQIDAPLALTHTATRPKTQDLVLFERIDYGIAVQAATAVLRFGAPQAERHGPFGLLGGRARLPRFEAGDLVGILPPGSTIARYYSLASASRDGVLEICVRKQNGGLCSEFLHALEPGSRVEAFIRRNPDFRPFAGRAPVIMIGAGTGIAPLAGFIRHNTRHKPIHLYWGGRDPRSDFLYEGVLAEALSDRRLARVVTAFSRIVGGQYVQDKVRGDAETLRQLVGADAQIIVCGGKEMAEGVREAIDEALTPIGVTAIALKAKGKYLEDVY